MSTNRFHSKVPIIAARTVFFGAISLVVFGLMTHQFIISILTIMALILLVLIKAPGKYRRMKYHRFGDKTYDIGCNEDVMPVLNKKWDC